MSERIFCPGCGTVLEDVEKHVAHLEEQLTLLERDLRGKRSQIARLKGEQADARPPEYDDAMEVAEFWREWLMPGAKELNGPRLQATIQRLHYYDKEDLKTAVWGYYCRPNVKNGQGRVRCTEGGKREVDLELLMRDGKHVDAGIAFAKAERHHDQGILNEGGSRQVARLCDCGHARADHGLFWKMGHESCYGTDCRCEQFDDTQRQADEWLERNGYFDKQDAQKLAHAEGRLL